MRITDDNCVYYLRKRNERAIEFVIDEYGWIINSVLRKELRNYPDMIEECFNDSLMFIWNHIDSFDASKSAFTTWIGIVSKYRAIDAKRRLLKKVKNEVYIEENEIGQEDDSYTMVLEEEVVENLEEFVSELSEVNRGIFWDYYIEEYGMDEICEKFDLTSQAVYNRLSRSREKLRKSLESKK